MTLLKHYVLPFLALACISFLLTNCKKDTQQEPSLQFSFKFDSNQERLNNLGLPSTIPAGNAAQTPDFHGMSVHYIELAPSAFTQLGDGAIVYHATETTKGGDNAVDFDLAAKGKAGEVFTRVNLKDVAPGTYEWVRASVTYQNYDVVFNINALPVVGDLKNQKGTVASFVGFNTYLTTVTPREKSITVNDDKKQGFWAFETNLSAPYDVYNQIYSGDAPAGATTVVNPIANTSPIPAGSCVVTGKFATPLVITGEESGDIEVVLSFSINNSFEWQDTNGNGQLDIYGDGTPAEKIVDMGLRGLIPSHN
ncbi:MAG: hypothetical protein H6576_10585 [Lewinellaceae bacterium]|nr:hypothetical protein [Saprospiraceae bacterium]MCB9344136.1 hypothetical protein [Lewinellaceae bacterium]